MRTTKAQESKQLLIIQSQALFVIHYLTYKSKDYNAKCCHNAFLNESLMCVELTNPGIFLSYTFNSPQHQMQCETSLYTTLKR